MWEKLGNCEMWAINWDQCRLPYSCEEINQRNICIAKIGRTAA